MTSPAHWSAGLKHRLVAPVPPAVRDVLLAVLVGFVHVGATVLLSSRQDTRRAQDVLGVALLMAAPLLLVMRRRYPVAVLFGTITVTLAYALLDYPMGPVFLPMIVALATALTAGRRVAAYAALGYGYVGFVWVQSFVVKGEAPRALEAGGLLAWLLFLASVGEALRIRKAHREAQKVSAQLKETSRKEAEQRRHNEERLRIARELHDVLAHHISLMNVQASVGLELMDGNPEQARTALTAVKQASREALGELRSALALLKGQDETAPRAPTVGLDNLDDLAARTSAGGLAVTVTRSGPVRPLPPPVDLAAYRIVQESLTNVVRHAGADTAEVRVMYGSDSLSLVIEDDGTGVPDRELPSGGNGLRGMQERATALGGRVTTGRMAAGGFRVTAYFPRAADDPWIRHDVSPVADRGADDLSKAGDT